MCAPAACVEYSDLGYIALGLVIERATGEPLADSLRERLLDDLGLRHTWFAGDDAAPRGTATTYIDGKTDDGLEEGFGSRTWAAGAMIATAGDLLRWGTSLFDRDVVPDELRAQMIDPLPTIALPCTPAACAGRYGLGVGISRLNGHLALGHGGSTGSFLASIPDLHVTIAVLTNQAESGAALASRMATALGLVDRADVWSIGVDGTGLRRLTAAPDVNGGPDWSRDGTQLVFGSTRDGQPELYLMDPDGGRQRRLTNHPSNDLAGRFSPDGSRVVFASDRAANFDIWTVNPDGSDPRRLTDAPDDERLASYSPGGRIAFEVGPDGDRDIATMNADGSDRFVYERPGDQWNASWSPTGERIAYADRGAGIRTMASDGTDIQQIAGTLPGDRFPAWGPADLIAFTTRIGDLWVMRPDGRDRRPIALTLEEEFGAAWSPDGTQLAFASDRA